jgi:hypothetical protein
MQNDAGPQQTDVWPLVWADLDPARLPAWVVWQRTCQFKATDGRPCPRRMAGSHFNVPYCDHHRPEGASNSAGQAIG